MWLTHQKANFALYLPLIKFIFRKNQYKSYGICYTFVLNTWKCNKKASKCPVWSLGGLLMLFRLFKGSSALFLILSHGQLNTLFWSAVNHTPSVIPIGSKLCLSLPTLTNCYMGNMFLRLKQSDRPIRLLLTNYTLCLARRYILTRTTWDAYTYHLQTVCLHYLVTMHCHWMPCNLHYKCVYSSHTATWLTWLYIWDEIIFWLLLYCSYIQS